MNDKLQALKETLTDIRSSAIWALKEIKGLEPEKCPGPCHGEPKAPAHKEIMTKWWKDEAVWNLVTGYNVDRYWWGTFWHESEWFTGRQSADIPPEAS